MGSKDETESQKKGPDGLTGGLSDHSTGVWGSLKNGETQRGVTPFLCVGPTSCP